MNTSPHGPSPGWAGLTITLIFVAGACFIIGLNADVPLVLVIAFGLLAGAYRASGRIGGGPV